MTDIKAMVSIIPFVREDKSLYYKNVVYFMVERVSMAIGILRQPNNVGGDDDDDNKEDTL